MAEPNLRSGQSVHQSTHPGQSGNAGATEVEPATRAERICATAARHEAIARAICRSLHPKDDPERIAEEYDPPLRLWHRHLKAAAALDAALAQREAARG